MICASVGVNSSLLLAPARLLTFELPAAEQSRALSTQVTLSNLSANKHIVFKIRTTQPDLFTVKPAQGVIAPLASEQIAITVLKSLRAQVESLSPEELTKRPMSERFLVQSVDQTDDMSAQHFDPSNMRAFWARIPKEVVSSHTLQCQFVAAPVRVKPPAASSPVNPAPELPEPLAVTALLQQTAIQPPQRPDEPRVSRDSTVFHTTLMELEEMKAESVVGSDLDRSRASSAFSRMSMDSQPNSSEEIAKGVPIFSILPADGSLLFHVPANADTVAPPLPSTAAIYLANPSFSHCLAFKIKTTNRSAYVIQPSRGLIYCNTTQQVRVLLYHDGSARASPVSSTDERILVDLCPVEEPAYGECMALPDPERKREMINRLWSRVPTRNHEKALLRCKRVVAEAAEAPRLPPSSSF